MLDGALARRYARALFELAAEAGALDATDRELREITDILQASPDLRHMLGHPRVEAAEKRAVLEQIFGTKIRQLTRQFFYLLLDRRRQGILPSIQREFSRMADEKNQVVEATVTSAADLNAAQRRGLKAVVRKLTGKNARLLSRVDPDLIGGAKLKIGDRVMDGSLASRLGQMRRDLTLTL
ncbi:MAG: F0F1 ATP synthase subunit delta [Gracilibacteraceae bacterium]|jgi:F-type H+-transporting ATPase subunit delta|nr:F0F1 ATP synthase subunit delta [Gracilibacteraceae bacterium]